MLELKNQDIVVEFLHLYDAIFREISRVKFEDIEKEIDRNSIMRSIEDRLVELVLEKP